MEGIIATDLQLDERVTCASVTPHNSTHTETSTPTVKMNEIFLKSW